MKINPDTQTVDVTACLANGEEQRAKALKKGQRVTITGKLYDWGTLLYYARLTDAHVH